MSQRFIKGLTNNHLTWVMVDATDFATPESSLSATTKIRIYGKLRGATGVNTVGSSGVGSLTNDIQHVGASATGMYTIALAKADLSDASAAWYDQYIIHLSDTGGLAARQTLVVDGGIVESALLALSDAVSNVQSYLVVMSGVQSDLYSLVSDFRSDFQSRVPKAVATNSQLSDLHSDLRSFLAVMSDVQSDFYSDFQSRVPKRVATDSQLSDLHSDLKSYLVVMSGVQSDIYSLLSDTRSTTDSQFAVTSNYLSNASNYLSYISAVVSGLGAGQSASAIADKVWSDYQSKVGQSPSQVYSNISNMLSYLSATVSDFQSDFQSRVPKAVATNSQLSDLHSDIRSYLIVMSGVQSDIYSLLSDTRSTADSQFAVTSNYLSNASNYLSYISGVVSGLGTGASASAIADKVWSDYQSKVGQSPSQVYSFTSNALSDLLSRINSASFLSDIASHVWAAKYTANSAASSFGSLFSDVSSKVVALAATFDLSDIQSHLDVIQNNIDNGFTIVDNAISDLHSDFQSRVPKAVATNSQLSDLHSDLKSYLVGMSGAISDVDSALNSQFAVTSNYLSNASNYLSNISATLSDVRSDVSDLHSDLLVMSGILSDVASALTVIDSRVLLTQSAASNADSIVQLLNTAHAEPTGVPAANATPLNKIGFLYEALRNKLTVTSTKLTFFDDAEVAQWEKDLSDDGTTYTETEANTV